MTVSLSHVTVSLGHMTISLGHVTVSLSHVTFSGDIAGSSALLQHSISVGRDGKTDVSSWKERSQRGRDQSTDHVPSLVLETLNRKCSNCP